jgi:hypothetical protein
MSAPGKRRGRPPKFTTDEERKAAKQKTKKESYQRQRDRKKNTPYQQEPQYQQDNVAAAPGLQIQLDPLSILQQAGPEEDGLTAVPNQQITAPDRGIPAVGFGDSGEDLLPATEDTYADKPILPNIGSLSIYAETSTLPPLLNQPAQPQRQSRSHLVTPPIPNNYLIRAEEDNKGADTEEGAQWQLAERVRSTASTQSSSLARESPLPQLAQWLEPVLLLQEEDSAEADDIDWATHSDNDYTDNASNSDDGPEDRRARQAGSNEPTANDEDGEVEQEQYTGAAASRLQMAWNKRCTCST